VRKQIPCGNDRWKGKGPSKLEGLVVEAWLVGAGEAETLAVAFDEAVKVDAFAAVGASDSLAFEAGELVGRKRDSHPLFVKEIGVRKFAIGHHLLWIFFEIGVEFFGAGFGAFESDDPEAFVVVAVELCVEVDEGCGHLAEVTQLERALAYTAAGDYADGVGGAAVDLNEGDEAFTVGVEIAVCIVARTWIVDSEAREREHGHADTKNLSGAEMSVGDLGVVEKVVKRGRHRSNATLFARRLGIGGIL
jgi:hypothetical protein